MATTALIVLVNYTKATSVISQYSSTYLKQVEILKSKNQVLQVLYVYVTGFEKTRLPRKIVNI